MKERFNKLNIYFRVTICSLILLVLFTLALAFLFFIGYKDIPLGIILGGTISIISYLALGLFEKRSEPNSKGIWSIVISISRFIVLAITITISGWLYYARDIRVFNVFAVMGGYLFPLVMLLLLTLLSKKGSLNV